MDNKTTAMTDNTLTVEALEDEIRRHVEWWYSADRLASDLAPFINRHIAAVDYSACCDTPAYCSSVRRCTAKDIILEPPKPAGAVPLPETPIYMLAIDGSHIHFADGSGSTAEQMIESVTRYRPGAKCDVQRLYTEQMLASYGDAREAAGRAGAVPAGWRESVTRAMDRARVFDDGTDGADAESARSVVAILSGLLAHIPQQATAHGKGEDTLASLIASAIRMDENGAGCDLPAGIFGPHMTRLIHDLAARHHCEPAGSETVAYTVTHVQGCTVVGYFLLEVETDNPPKTGDILYTHPSPVVDAEALASEVGEVVEFQDGTREWTFQSDTLIAFARRLTGSKSDA